MASTDDKERNYVTLAIDSWSCEKCKSFFHSFFFCDIQHSRYKCQSSDAVSHTGEDAFSTFLQFLPPALFTFLL